VSDRIPAIVRLAFICRPHRGLRSTKPVVASRFHLGKGGKERATPLHLEAVERLAAWLAHHGVKNDPAVPLFPAARTSRGLGRDGFRELPMTTRAVEKLIGRYVCALGLDPNVTVHSLRVTALTTARERGADNRVTYQSRSRQIEIRSTMFRVTFFCHRS
jgi:integrase